MFPLTALVDVGMKVLDKFIPDPQAKAKAQQELLKMQQEGRLAELNADNIEAQELTKRQEADMKSNSNYVELLGQWGMLIMSFYFGGRTLEKIMDMKSKSGEKANATDK